MSKKAKEDNGSYIMTPEKIADYVAYETAKGASENMRRRYACAANAVFDFLPEDKLLTKERLLLWRKDMEDSGYAPATIQYYVTYFNRYLDYFGCSDIRFNRGHPKDIKNVEFGYLTAIELTDKKYRRSNVWLCRCRCGNMVEVPTNNLTSYNTVSCGCIAAERLKRANKTFADTHLRNSLEEQIVSAKAKSGYVGVVPKRNKWQAYIIYQKKYYNLGCYKTIEEAVAARAIGKKRIQEDAKMRLDLYNDLHKNDAPLPGKKGKPAPQDTVQQAQANDDMPIRARRRNNTSGHTGVSFVDKHWEARICYKGVRYILGKFGQDEEAKEKAIALRQQAEKLLKQDPELFIETYKDSRKNHM